MTWFAYILLLFGLSWACVGLFQTYAIEKGMLDKPSARSSHFAVTARGGGVVFFVGWFILLGVLNYLKIVSTEMVWIFLPCILAGFIGFLDDHKGGISSTTRLIFQGIGAIATLLLIGEGGALIQNILPISLPLPACFLILVLAIIWMINLYNFMDGADGIAATQAMMVFGIGGYILMQSQAYELAILAWSLVALLGGFLIWNWPTARIFMGDSGSYFLGFMIAIYALISHKYFNINPLIWIILTAPFWFDTTITLIRRIIAREEWSKPHRQHAYQRLIQAGWSHQKVLFGVIAINIPFAGLALLAFRDPRLLSFSMGVTLVLLICIYISVEIIRPMNKKWY